MKVSIVFPVKSKRQRNSGRSLDFVIRISDKLNQQVVKKTMEEYQKVLTEKFGFQKVLMWTSGTTKITFTCSNNESIKTPLSASTFIRYLANQGYVEITNIADFEKMEKSRLWALYNKHANALAQIQSFDKYASRKVPMNKKDFLKLYQKLQKTRDTIEQLSYREEQSVDWIEKINDCDIILTYINDFYWDFNFFILIDKKVKEELYFFSDFYDNMKEFELLTFV